LSASTSFDADDSDPVYVRDVAESNEIASRIRKVRSDAGLSQQSFADRLGSATRGAVGNWERGQGIKRENLLLIAEKFRVPFEWLATGNGPGYTKDGTKEYQPPNAIVGEKLTERGEYIPLYGHAVGGVFGEFILNGNKLDDILAPPGLSPARGAYAVTCAGDSMEPRYFDGETVFVDPTKRVSRGDFVVAQIANPNEGMPPLAFIKRFVRHNDNELVLEQFNPIKQLTFEHQAVVSVHFIVLGGRPT
jgi:phage repressor protein C with HTH and peptisase S24 domain